MLGHCIKKKIWCVQSVTFKKIKSGCLLPLPLSKPNRNFCSLTKIGTLI